MSQPHIVCLLGINETRKKKDKLMVSIYKIHYQMITFNFCSRSTVCNIYEWKVFMKYMSVKESFLSLFHIPHIFP